MFRRFLPWLMIVLVFAISASTALCADEDEWQPLIDTMLNHYDFEQAVLLLIDGKHIPVSTVIQTSRDRGFGDTRIVDALVDTLLSCEQVIIEALQNDIPPQALFNSDKICGSACDYLPDSILRFLVQELQFMKEEEAEAGNKEENIEAKKNNFKIIIIVSKSLINDEDYSLYDVMLNLCQANASHELLDETIDTFDVPQATAYRACPKHAEYGKAYISNDLPQEAYIIIGVDHLTLDSISGNGIISPKAP